MAETEIPKQERITLRKRLEMEQIEQAQKKAENVRKPVDNLLVLTIVINRDTGKVLDIVSKPSVCNNNLTVNNSVENRFEKYVKYLDKAGYDVYERK